MRYRKFGAGDDYAFGSSTQFLVNTPATVAQVVLTRLRLYAKEWFLDTREGLDKDLILGYRTSGTRDMAIRARILGTPGVVAIVEYSSNVSAQRAFTVAARLDTVYGAVVINQTF